MVVQASNDMVVDTAGTIVTVESLYDWLEGFAQHRTVSLQHNMPLRDIPPKPQVGVAVEWDMAPQLQVRVKITDPIASELIAAGKIRGASLEFVPAPGGIERVQVGDREAIRFRALRSEPEATGLALVDYPAVPGSNILSMRSLAPNWAYAVVDPRVLNGEVTNPEDIEALRWFPHHRIELARPVDLEAAMRGRIAAENGDFEVPKLAKLSKGEVARRAVAHLERHTGVYGRVAGDSPAKQRHAKVKRIVVRL